MNTDSKQPEPLQVQPKTPSVHIVVSETDGTIVDMIGGTNPILAEAISFAHKIEHPGIVSKRVGRHIGQDIYDVRRDYILSLRGLFFFLPHKDVAHLDTNWPDGRITVLVTF